MKDSVGRLGKGFKTVTIYSSEPRISIKGIYSKWIYADTPKQIQVEFQTLTKIYEGEKLEEERNTKYCQSHFFINVNKISDNVHFLGTSRTIS